MVQKVPVICVVTAMLPALPSRAHAHMQRAYWRQNALHAVVKTIPRAGVRNARIVPKTPVINSTLDNAFADG